MLSVFDEGKFLSNLGFTYWTGAIEKWKLKT